MTRTTSRTTGSSDGRLARGERTRQRVAESLIDLLEEGNTEPTAREIAQRAGVSLRLVFHHFDAMEELYHAVYELQMERHWTELPSVPSAGCVHERCEAFAGARAVLFEAVSPVRRAATRRSDRSPAISAKLDASHELLTSTVVDTFAPELAAAGPNRAEVLGALDAAASWECWEHLRSVQALSVAEATAVMASLLDAVATRVTGAPARAADPALVGAAAADA